MEGNPREPKKLRKLQTPETPRRKTTFETPEELFDYYESVRIKKIIDDTVNATIIKLKMSGLMKDNKKTAFQKTEELLHNYETFKAIKDQPYTERIVKIIDNALYEIKDDIYYDIIPLMYFKGETREFIAEYFKTTVTTISRNKVRLVNKLKIMLFSDDVIYELFL